MARARRHHPTGVTRTRRMRARRAAYRAVLLLSVVATLTGCKFYWSKPGGTADDFNRDSLECIKESSPTPEAAKYGIPSEKIYKACLRHRGWARENGPGGEGFYRGIEDFD
jgi:hypothetical protein